VPLSWADLGVARQRTYIYIKEREERNIKEREEERRRKKKKKSQMMKNEINIKM
jgi:hypothetical protein